MAVNRIQVFLILAVVGGAIAFLVSGLLSCHPRMPGFTGCVDHAANLSFAGRRPFKRLFITQQGYYLEHQRLATTFSALGFDRNSHGTPGFNYAMESQSTFTLLYSIPTEPRLPVKVNFQGISWTETYPVYSAVMAIVPPVSLDKPPAHLVCQNLQPGVIKPNPPQFKNGQLICAATTRSVRL